MPKTNNIANNNAFQFKGSAFTLTVLQLLDTNMDAFTHQLANLAQQTPRFFQHTPIILDLQKLAQSESEIPFQSLSEQMRQHSLIPVGVCGGNTTQQQAALATGLAILPASKAEQAGKNTSSSALKDTQTITSPSKIITHPVRSGQQIYAQGGDLIVLASVSTGAELLADGHIHIYGTLRGRALAGLNGDTSARIFCQALAAELVSISGHYWVSEDLQHHTDKNPVQIYLENERLKLVKL